MIAGQLTYPSHKCIILNTYIQVGLDINKLIN
jgi:hypothetical protein